MKTLLLFFLLGLCQCSAPDTETAFGSEEKITISKFEQAQNEGDTAVCISYLSLRGNSALYCALIEKASQFILESHLKSSGFISTMGDGFAFHFGALSAYKQEEISCLIERISQYPIDKNELQNALKIAGINLADSIQRDSFIHIQILKSKDYTATELLFLSNLIKLDPGNSYFEQGFNSIVRLADEGSVKLFLTKSGFVAFDRHSDEYTTYHPEKLAHLSDSTLNLVLARAALRVP